MAAVWEETLALGGACAVADEVEHVVQQRLRLREVAVAQQIEVEVGHGHGVQAVHACIRAVVPPMMTDRPIYEDVAAVRIMIDDGSLLASAGA